MKTRFSLLLAALCGLVSVASVHAQSTAFTYQGRLNQNEAPATGLFDVRFTLFGEATGGSPVSNPITNSVVGMTNGLFTVLLDFGSDPFPGADRWLDIAVRPAGGGTFTPLTPRQPITPTPYAVTALFAKQVPGVSGNALHAADGSPQNAVFVDNAGNAGVGTTSPVTRLHVTTSASANPASPRVESSGTSGFGAGWDFYHGTTGKGYVGVPDSGAAFAPGELMLFGGPETKVSLWPGGVRTLTADTAGNVQVSGEVKLGASGEFRAASGEESLRIVRGMVDADGTILRGSGFTVIRTTIGDYQIVFSNPFSGPPVLTVSQERTGTFPFFVQADEVTASSAKVFVQVVAANFTFPRIDSPFHFIAIGPR